MHVAVLLKVTTGRYYLVTYSTVACCAVIAWFSTVVIAGFVDHNNECLEA